MANQPEHSSAKVSRRSVLLQGAACAAGAATILAQCKFCKGKSVAKKQSVYQDTPKGDRQCSGCSLFVAPSSCKNVAGVISPNGWCMLWRKA